MQKDEEPVLKLNNICKVDENPDQPRREAAETQPIEVRNRSGAANRRQVSAVLIVEGLNRSAAEPSRDRVTHVSPFLNGGLGDARKRFSGLMAEIREIAEHKNFRMTGNG